MILTMRYYRLGRLIGSSWSKWSSRPKLLETFERDLVSNAYSNSGARLTAYRPKQSSQSGTGFTTQPLMFQNNFKRRFMKRSRNVADRFAKPVRLKYIPRRAPVTFKVSQWQTFAVSTFPVQPGFSPSIWRMGSVFVNKCTFVFVVFYAMPFNMYTKSGRRISCVYLLIVTQEQHQRLKAVVDWPHSSFHRFVEAGCLPG